MEQVKDIEKQTEKQSKIIEIKEAFKGKWIGMNYVTYSVGDKVIPNYECVYRMTRKEGCKTDGVEVIPVIKYANKKSQVVLIANYRPPVGGFCLEFPSGLVEDDNYLENMKRQLQEQTGYVLSKTVKFPEPTLYIDPWKSNQSSILYIGIIDGDDPKHKKEQSLDATENIKVFTFDLDEQFPNKLKDFADANNYLMEGKLWGICTGLILGTLI